MPSCSGYLIVRVLSEMPASFLSLLGSSAVASVVSCVENNARLAPFHNSFRGGGGTGVWPHVHPPQWGGCCLRGRVTVLPSSLSLSLSLSLSYTHTHTHIGNNASMHTRMQICKCACMQALMNIFLRLALGHIFLATKVIPTDKHILITWAPVASGNKH